MTIPALARPTKRAGKAEVDEPDTTSKASSTT
jgi:hypothetical protein